jgi:hypothetical protein
MRAIAALLVAVTALLPGGPARAACDCTDATPSIVLPRDGATGVPTNARAVVSAEVVGESRWAGADASAALPALGVAPIAQPAKGKAPAKPGKAVAGSVATMLSEAWGTVYVVTPKQPLKPKTVYAVVKTSKTATDIIATFTTGDGPDAAPPVFGGIESFTVVLAFVRKQGDCDGEPPSGQLTWKLGAVTDDSAGPADLLRILYIQKKGEQRTIRLIEPWDRKPVTAVTNKVCDPFHPILKAGDEVCAIVEAVDLAGNVAGSAVEKCMTVRPI